MDIDHKEEHQLGGANTTDNMQALDARANRSSGSRIHGQMLKAIATAVKPHIGQGPFKTQPKGKELAALKAEYELTFKEIKGDQGLDPEDKDAKWEKDEVEKVQASLDALTKLSPQEILANKLLSGTKTRLVLFPLSSGGVPKNIPWDADNRRPRAGIDFENQLGFKGLKPPVNMTYDEDAHKGNITGWFKPKKKSIMPYPIGPILLSGVGDLPFTCKMDTGGLLQSMKFAELYGFSPVEFREATFDERGLYARGTVAPSLQLLKKFPIDIVVEGDDVKLETTITKEGFSLPGPLKVTEGTLTLSLGTSGPEAEGSIGIAVERVGEGRIGAKMGTDGLELHGSFDLDKKIFDSARIELHYVKDVFSGSGELGIPPGRVRGIKSATIKAYFAKDEFGASGTIKPDIPAVEEAGLGIEFKKETGLKFTGDLAIKKDVPGIEGGSIHVEASKPPDGDEFKVKASGSAKPKIPGVDTMLQVSYDDGTFDASVVAAYKRGRLKGSIQVGATNRQVTDGQPSGPAPEKATKTSDITVYGGGSLTIALGPLEGTVTVHILPNGEIEVGGEIALTTRNVPPQLGPPNKKLLDFPSVHIPIWGVSIWGHDIGVFASVGGGIEGYATIGPGELTGRLGVEYNPAHEENTKVWGKATWHLPANAGVRLFVYGGIGLSALIVKAEGRVELGFGLGVEGALDAEVGVEWTPTKGVSFDAEAKFSVHPKLVVDLSLRALVEADLLFGSITLWEPDPIKLAGFEFGSSLSLGVSFPVHYQEGQPFDFSLDKVKFEYPKVDPLELGKDVIKSKL
jgi:hypothetical protein